MKPKKQEKQEPERKEPKKTIAIIPMRAGSKGIPNKNMIAFCGKALCRWTIDQATRSGRFDKVIVSTDSAEYREKIDLWYPGAGLVPYLRPEELARNSTPTKDVILDILEREPGYDTFVLLEPTSPVRCNGDIGAALDMFNERNAKAMISVSYDHRTHPAIMFELSKDGRCLIEDTPHLRRQELRPVYHPTGLLYIANVDWYVTHQTFLTNDTVGYKVQPWQDHEIDDEWDIDICAALMGRIK